jgi:predicted nucleic acid-binding protein
VAASRAVFLDTAGLIAAARPRDSLHGKAKVLLNQFERERVAGVTSDWVLTELLAGMSALGERQEGAAYVRWLMRMPHVRVIEATRDSWLDALALYEARHDKEWSLVDCHSILACKASKITRVLTSDHHFRQAGLVPLM